MTIDYEQFCKSIFKDIEYIEYEDLQKENTLIDLGISSIDLLSMLAQIQDEYGVIVSTDEIDFNFTLLELYNFTIYKVNEKHNDKIEYLSYGYSSFHNVISNMVKVFGERTALVRYDGGKTRNIRYKDFIKEVKALAKSLDKQENGDKNIGIVIKDKYLLLKVFMAVLYNNCIPVIIPSEVFEYGKADECCASIVSDNELEFEDKFNEHTSLGDDDLYFYRNTFRNISRTEESCVILYTSGTGGFNKGVILGIDGIIANIDSFSRAMYCENNHVTTLEYTHAFGLFVGCLWPLFNGKCIHIVKSIDSLKEVSDKKQIDVLCCVPLTMDYIRKHYNLKNISIKKILVGGAKLDTCVGREFEDNGIKVCQLYGITECTAAVTVNREFDGNLKSVGEVLNGYEILQPKDIEEEEIVIKSKAIYRRYVGGEEASTYYHTGDIGYLENGKLIIVGRANNKIVRSDGNNIYPEFIESILREIADVQDALVYEDGGVLCADIYSDKRILDKVEIKKECNKKLPVYMRLQQIIIKNQPLERNRIGKLVRRAV